MAGCLRNADPTPRTNLSLKLVLTAELPSEHSTYTLLSFIGNTLTRWCPRNRQQGYFSGDSGQKRPNVFRMVVAEARSLIRQRNEITQADDLLRNSRDYQILRQIPGIGPINALTIIAEAGDLRCFHHHRQFLKFCGLICRHSNRASIAARPDFPLGNARLRRTLQIAGQAPSASVRTGFRHKFPNATSREIVTIPSPAARHNRYYRQDGVSHAVVKSAVQITSPSLKGGPGGRTSRQLERGHPSNDRSRQCLNQRNRSVLRTVRPK